MSPRRISLWGLGLSERRFSALLKIVSLFPPMICQRRKASSFLAAAWMTT